MGELLAARGISAYYYAPRSLYEWDVLIAKRTSAAKRKQKEIATELKKRFSVRFKWKDERTAEFLKREERERKREDRQIRRLNAYALSYGRKALALERRGFELCKRGGLTEREQAQAERFERLHEEYERKKMQFINGALEGLAKRFRTVKGSPDLLPLSELYERRVSYLKEATLSPITERRVLDGVAHQRTVGKLLDEKRNCDGKEEEKKPSTVGAERKARKVELSSLKKGIPSPKREPLNVTERKTPERELPQTEREEVSRER